MRTPTQKPTPMVGSLCVAIMRDFHSLVNFAQFCYARSSIVMRQSVPAADTFCRCILVKRSFDFHPVPQNYAPLVMGFFPDACIAHSNFTNTSTALSYGGYYYEGRSFCFCFCGFRDSDNCSGRLATGVTRSTCARFGFGDHKASSAVELPHAIPQPIALRVVGSNVKNPVGEYFGAHR